MAEITTQLSGFDFQGTDGERYRLSLGQNGSGEVATIKVQRLQLEKTTLGEYWSECSEPQKINIPNLSYSERFSVKQAVKV